MMIVLIYVKDVFYEYQWRMSLKGLLFFVSFDKISNVLKRNLVEFIQKLLIICLVNVSFEMMQNCKFDLWKDIDERLRQTPFLVYILSL